VSVEVRKKPRLRDIGLSALGGVGSKRRLSHSCTSPQSLGTNIAANPEPGWSFCQSNSQSLMTSEEAAYWKTETTRCSRSRPGAHGIPGPPPPGLSSLHYFHGSLPSPAQRAHRQRWLGRSLSLPMSPLSCQPL
jgi:hypothetical protein